MSVEDQRTADERIPLLLHTPAAVRFVSAEPLIGPIVLSGLLPGESPALHWVRDFAERLSWLIVGGESGPTARPCDVAWIRSIVGQCRDAGVSVFCKQLGSLWASKLGGKGKGSEMELWPEDLRAREFPNANM